MKEIIAIDKNIRIIGRTRIDIDIHNDDSFLHIDGNNISKYVDQFIIDRKIDELPVDVIKIANDCKWLIVPYSKADKSILGIYEEIMYTDWGFTIYFDNQYIIFFNDEIKIGSQRFTIAHEIGHIVLEHFDFSNARTREKEANMFAASLLMPIDVLRACNIQSRKDIEILCGVSYSAACYRYEKALKVNNDESLFRNKVLKQFQKFINTYKKKININ